MYIGQTCQKVEARFRAHIRAAISGEYVTRFTKAINEYGPDAFYWEIIDTANSHEELNTKERYWIKFYNSHIDGYNMTPGGYACGGDTYSYIDNLDDVRKKISDSKKWGKNPMAVPVTMYDIENETTAYFSSMKEAADCLGLSSHMPISRQCRHKSTKPILGRFLFDYSANEGVTTMENAHIAQ